MVVGLDISWHFSLHLDGWLFVLCWLKRGPAANIDTTNTILVPALILWLYHFWALKSWSSWNGIRTSHVVRCGRRLNRCSYVGGWLFRIPFGTVVRILLLGPVNTIERLMTKWWQHFLLDKFGGGVSCSTVSHGTLYPLLVGRLTHCFGSHRLPIQALPRIFTYFTLTFTPFINSIHICNLVFPRFHVILNTLELINGFLYLIKHFPVKKLVPFLKLDEVIQQVNVFRLRYCIQ